MSLLINELKEGGYICPIHGIDYDIGCEECTSVIIEFLKKNYLHYFIIKMMMQQDEFSILNFNKDGLNSFKRRLLSMKNSAASLLKEVEESMTRDELMKHKDSNNLIRLATFKGTMNVLDSIMKELDKVSESSEI